MLSDVATKLFVYIGPHVFCFGHPMCCSGYTVTVVASIIFVVVCCICNYWEFMREMLAFLVIPQLIVNDVPVIHLLIINWLCTLVDNLIDSAKLYGDIKDPLDQCLNICRSEVVTFWYIFFWMMNFICNFYCDRSNASWSNCCQGLSIAIIMVCSIVISRGLICSLTMKEI